MVLDFSKSRDLSCYWNIYTFVTKSHEKARDVSCKCTGPTLRQWISMTHQIFTWQAINSFSLLSPLVVCLPLLLFYSSCCALTLCLYALWFLSMLCPGPAWPSPCADHSALFGPNSRVPFLCFHFGSCLHLCPLSAHHSYPCSTCIHAHACLLPAILCPPSTCIHAHPPTCICICSPPAICAHGSPAFALTPMFCSPSVPALFVPAAGLHLHLCSNLHLAAGPNHSDLCHICIHTCIPGSNKRHQTLIRPIIQCQAKGMNVTLTSLFHIYSHFSAILILIMFLMG